MTLGLALATGAGAKPALAYLNFSTAPLNAPLTLVESGQRLTHQLRPSAAPSSEPDESTLTSGRNGRARRARPARIQNLLP